MWPRAPSLSSGKRAIRVAATRPAIRFTIRGDRRRQCNAAGQRCVHPAGPHSRKCHDVSCFVMRPARGPGRPLPEERAVRAHYARAGAARVREAARPSSPPRMSWNVMFRCTRWPGHAVLRVPFVTPDLIRSPSMAPEAAAAGEERDRPPKLPREPGLDPGSALTRRPGVTEGRVRCEATEGGCVNPVGRGAAGGPWRPVSPPVAVRGSFAVMRASFGARGGTGGPCFARVSRGRACGGAGGVSRRRGSRGVIARARRHTHLARPLPPGSFSRPQPVAFCRKAERRPRKPPLSTFILHHIEKCQARNETKIELAAIFSFESRLRKSKASL